MEESTASVLQDSSLFSLLTTLLMQNRFVERWAALHLLRLILHGGNILTQDDEEVLQGTVNLLLDADSQVPEPDPLIFAQLNLPRGPSYESIAMC